LDLKTTSKQLSLVILAGGMGSRYNGQKQVDPIGPNREALMEYSIYDAIEVGVNHFVFIINQQFEDNTRKYFKKIIEEKGAFVEFILQTTHSSVPRDYFDHIIDRVKPWGTGHALLVAKSHLNQPFIIINADDYYGQDAFQKAKNLVDQGNITSNKYGIVTYQIDRTLSENGSVSRGICKIENNILKDVVEHTNIFRDDENIVFEEKNISGTIEESTPVSMNFWVLHPSIFRALEDKFDNFMTINSKELKAEFFLPQVINELIHDKKVEVIAEQSSDQWFGMTYPDDKMLVQTEINSKIEDGLYPQKLWN